MSMRGACVATLVVSLLALAARAQDAENAREVLKGTWQVDDMVVNGKRVLPDQLEGATVAFAGPKMTMTSRKGKAIYRYKLDPSKDPKAIDTTAIDGPFRGKTTPGI